MFHYSTGRALPRQGGGNCYAGSLHAPSPLEGEGRGEGAEFAALNLELTCLSQTRIQNIPQSISKKVET